MVKYKKYEKYTKPRDEKEFLQLAIYRESAAVAFYEDMLKHNFSNEIKGLITELISEECTHRTRLEKKIRELA
jgi:rubrerythrin